MKLEQINYQAGLNVVRSDDHVWVTAKQIEMLLEAKRQSVSYHIKELEKLNQFVAGKHFVSLPLTRMEGSREVTRPTRHYSELAVMRIGFRMNSPKALAFQEWAAETLLTLKRDDVTVKQLPGPVTEEKWDVAAAHDLLDGLGVAASEFLTTRIGLLAFQTSQFEVRPTKTKQPALLPDAKKKNEQRVLRIVKKYGPLTAAQIRSRSGCNAKYRLTHKEILEALEPLLIADTVVVYGRKYFSLQSEEQEE